MKIFPVILLMLSACAASVLAQRKPVLPQIEVPHPYYFGEMYLPQLTSGPSSVTWSPDSKEVVYSMAGSLWRQKIDSGAAQQLTDGPGYDYQPDWSPDGKNIVYVSYQNDALELWLLELSTGKATQLTNQGAVNVEPRWSPDGTKVALVSTAYNKRFHIFCADVKDGKLANLRRLTGETKSSLPRYYYSAFDHEISPVWTRDGQEILFVSNRGHIHGTGGFWRMKAQPGAEPREIHYEETNWRARPDFSPDGSRMVYSSYLGRSWHQLWLLPANGGDAFPISYGDWDETAARWSPDGKSIAFISNRNGNTELRVREIPGNSDRLLAAKEFQYLRPHGKLQLQVTDETGKNTAARISITDAAGRSYAPKTAWINTDNGYDRKERKFEAHYFHVTGNVDVDVDVDVPAGTITVEVMKGFRHIRVKKIVEVQQDQTTNVIAELKPLDWVNPAGEQWTSSDLHVHMNYAGNYRNTPQHLVQQAAAEDLDIVNDLIVNKEQRFPDIFYNGKNLDEASNSKTIVVHGQEFHTSYWGHLGLLNIRGGILLPGYAGYPNTAAASLYPMNADVADMAHARGALVGYVHPFDEEPEPLKNPSEKITNELPVDVALGKVDYMEIVGFSDHRATANVWYRLLNLGFRIPAGAGTDAMANYAWLRGPVGMNRVYAKVPAGPLKIENFLSALKKGNTFATNGPLLDFSVEGKQVGGEIKLNAAQIAAQFSAKLRSIVPVDHLQVVCNGQVVQELEVNNSRTVADVAGTIPIGKSGWCVLRAWSEKAEYPVLDNYVYATTSPVYITAAAQKPASPQDAKYFLAWIQRIKDVTAKYPDWNSEQEKVEVMQKLADASAVYEKMQ
jgi:Tol biopolymer transport system component